MKGIPIVSIAAMNTSDYVGEIFDNIETTYRRTWLQQIRENGVSEEEMKAALERMKAD